MTVCCELSSTKLCVVASEGRRQAAPSLSVSAFEAQLTPVTFANRGRGFGGLGLVGMGSILEELNQKNVHVCFRAVNGVWGG